MIKPNKDSLLLYAVTDRAWCTKHGSLAEQVKKAIEGGVTLVQLREKELEAEEFYREAVEIKALCHGYGVPFIINDDVELAVRVGADGVHIGHGDMPVREARRMIGENMWLGVSADTVEAAVAAEREGADYLGVGAVFPTGTKSDASEVSHGLLSEITAAVDIPAVAIGGISLENMIGLKGTGIAGVSLISAIFASDGITDECRRLSAMARTVTEPPKKLTDLRGVIFDLDGTLLDSMYIWDTVGSDFLRGCGIEPEAGLDAKFKKMSLWQTADYYKKYYGFTEPHEELMARVNRTVEKFYSEKVVLKPGVRQFLERLRAAGVPMCVASATDLYQIEAALERNGVRDYFGEIFTCTLVGRGKDSPDIYEAALAWLGCRKDEAVIFEDALFAVKTAEKAGFITAAVADPSEAEQEAMRRIADYYVENFEEIGEVLNV